LTKAFTKKLKDTTLSMYVTQPANWKSRKNKR